MGVYALRIIFLLSLITAIACSTCASGSPSVTGATAPATAGLYEKFEATLSITTSAANYYWPYDPSPNTGVPAGIGVSVDGLFSSDNWQTTIVQPAFYCVDYETRPDIIVNGNAWTYPTGQPVWKVRFAPTKLGPWKYKVRVTDASGTVTSQEYSFDCVTSTNHGFVRISPTAGRYFELSDGTYTPFIGFSDVAKSKFPQISSMGVNLVRSWWQSSNPPMALFGAGGQGGDMVIGNLNYTTDYVRPNHLVSTKVRDIGSSWASVWNAINTTVCVKPNTNYKFSCIVKTVDLTGTGDYGLFIADHPKLTRSQRLTGTNDWQELSVTLNPGADTSLRAYVACTNTTSGTAYASDWSLKEVLGSGQYGPDLLPRPDFQSHSNYNQSIAKQIDDLLDTARQNGVYIKAVIEEKADSFFSRIQADGSWGVASDSNVYANPTHACRTYQHYYWRYLIARYGYSTALHSLELFNEADPFNGNHYEACNALGAYLKNNDPNKHLASSSNWHSFPPLMWRQADVGYSDIHMYLGKHVASGGNRLWPGWDGNWTIMNDTTGLGPNFQIDNTVAHSGSVSLKITVPPVVGDDGNTYAVSNAWFAAGAPLGHEIHVSYWAKGSNLVTYNKSWIKPGGIAIQYSEGGGDFAGYISGETGSPLAPWGTYDWQKLDLTFRVPTTSQPGANGRLPLILWVQPYCRATNSSQPGTLWIDDFVIQDDTTGQVLSYNGGFEHWDFESYDVVAGHCAYSQIIAGYQLNKPATRGEVALCYPQRFASPYKGFYYQGNANQPGEDQLLVDDTEGIWWRKWVWANMDPGGLVEIYWWPTLPFTRNYTFGKVYQNFMSGIPLSNGRYKDVNATVSNTDMRVLGQKDLADNCAHLWIDNAPYTWKAVVDHNYSPEPWSSSATYAKDSTCGGGSPIHVYKSLQDANKNHAVTDIAWWQDTGAFNAATNPPLPPAVTGTVTVSGFKDGPYKAEWWNTSTGAITRTEDIQCTGGQIVLSVQNLVSDIACQIYPTPAKVDLRVLVPSEMVVPGQVVTVTVEYTNSGTSEARDVEVSARVPAQMDYMSGSAEETGGSYDSLTQTVIWHVSRLAANETGTKTFRARVR